MKVKPYDLVRDTAVGTVVIEHRDGREERCAWLRLPSWGIGYDMCTDEMRWGQRVLWYFGHRGLEIRWRFPRENSN